MLRILLALCLTWPQCSAQDPVKVDPTHCKVLLENEHLRALSISYGPGEASPMHEHPAGVRIFLADAWTRFTFPDGSTREGKRSRNDVGWAEPVRHANFNLGKSPTNNIEIDFKRLPARKAQTKPLSASPDPTETVILENEFVRVLRLVVAPSSRSKPHGHPDLLIVTMSDGQVNWVPAGQHTISNPAATPLEIILVEVMQR